MKSKVSKVFFTIFIFLSVLYIFLPIPIGHQTGVYNTITGLYWCSDTYSCNHERAHKMDAQLGWISHSKEWRTALGNYVLEMYAQKTFTHITYLVLGKALAHENNFHQLITDEQAEIYADIFAISHASKAEMPDSLEPFYLWENSND